MSVLMKNRQKKVLPFPTLPEEPLASTMIVQIGNDRFAIHWEIEELAPVSPLVVWKGRARSNCENREITPDLPLRVLEGSMCGPKERAATDPREK